MKFMSSCLPGHSFHKRCIKRFIEHHFDDAKIACPSCRNEFTNATNQERQRARRTFGNVSLSSQANPQLKKKPTMAEINHIFEAMQK